MSHSNPTKLDSATTVLAALRDGAAEHPGAPAVRAGSVTLDYAQLHAAARRLARRLHDAGVTPGDRVAVALPNSLELAVCYLGVLAAGAVVVPLRPAHDRHLQQDRLLDCDPAAVLAAPDSRPGLVTAAATAGVPVFGVEPGELVDAGGPDDTDGDGTDVAPEVPAGLFYGLVAHDRPAAVELTHANLARTAVAAAALLRLGRSDTVLSCFPLASVIGLTLGINATLVAGACLSIPSDVDSAGLLRTLTEQQVTVLGTYPVLLPVLLRAVADRATRSVRSTADGSATALPALRTILVSGGAPTAASQRRALESTVGCEVLDSFGVPECSGLACATPSEGTGRSGSVGLPLDGLEARVVDRAGRDARVGDIGELVVRGPHTMVGYWRDPESTKRAFRGGWLYTGYSATVDEDGWNYLIDAGWAGKLNRPRPGGGRVRRLLHRLRRAESGVGVEVPPAR